MAVALRRPDPLSDGVRRPPQRQVLQPARGDLRDSDRTRPDLRALIAACAPGGGVYACGPERLLGACEQLVTARGDVTMHAERFRPRVREMPDPRPFTLVAKRSGLTTVVPADRSALQVLESSGVRLSSGCRTGLCGACEVSVLEGGIEHRDDVLTVSQKAAGRMMLPCISRATGETLVIDI